METAGEWWRPQGSGGDRRGPQGNQGMRGTHGKGVGGTQGDQGIKITQGNQGMIRVTQGQSYRGGGILNGSQGMMSDVMCAISALEVVS